MSKESRALDSTIVRAPWRIEESSALGSTIVRAPRRIVERRGRAGRPALDSSRAA